MSQQITIQQQHRAVPGCHGNCRQGRCCTCVADHEDAQAEQADSAAASTFWRWYGAGTLVAVLAYALWLQWGRA